MVVGDESEMGVCDCVHGANEEVVLCCRFVVRVMEWDGDELLGKRCRHAVHPIRVGPFLTSCQSFNVPVALFIEANRIFPWIR